MKILLIAPDMSDLTKLKARLERESGSMEITLTDNVGDAQCYLRVTRPHAVAFINAGSKLIDLAERLVPRLTMVGEILDMIIVLPAADTEVEAPALVMVETASEIAEELLGLYDRLKQRGLPRRNERAH